MNLLKVESERSGVVVVIVNTRKILFTFWNYSVYITIVTFWQGIYFGRFYHCLDFLTSEIKFPSEQCNINLLNLHKDMRIFFIQFLLWKKLPKTFENRFMFWKPTFKLRYKSIENRNVKCNFVVTNLQPFVLCND